MKVYEVIRIRQDIDSAANYIQVQTEIFSDEFSARQLFRIWDEELIEINDSELLDEEKDFKQYYINGCIEQVWTIRFEEKELR